MIFVCSIRERRLRIKSGLCLYIYVYFLAFANVYTEKRHRVIMYFGPIFYLAEYRCF